MSLRGEALDRIKKAEKYVGVSADFAMAQIFMIQLHIRRVVEICLKLLTLFAMTALKPPSRPLG